ncbi:MAG: EAL domain-containing protein [Pseudomonadota bacterium]
MTLIPRAEENLSAEAPAAAFGNPSDAGNADEEARYADTYAGIVQVQHEMSAVDLDLQSVMNLMVERAQALTRACGAVVELVEEDEMVYRATAGIAARQIGLRLRHGSSLSGAAIRTGMVMHCEDSEVDPHVDRSASRAIGVRSLIAAPLRVADQVIGVLKVMAMEPHAFRKRDVVNLQILVQSLGNVIQRHRDAERLRQSESQYRLMFEHNPHPMWVFENATLRFLAVNLSAIQHYGYTEQEFLAMTLRELRLPEDVDVMEQTVRSLPQEQKSAAVWRHRKKDGSIIQVEVSSDGIDFNGLPARLVLATDVTERLRAERELARVNRAQQMLSACHEALIRADQEATLLEEICRVTVEIGGYRMAWVGFRQEDPHKTILPVAHFGEQAAAYLGNIRISWSADEPIGRGPAGRTIRSGKVVVMENLSVDPGFRSWLDDARAHGHRSMVCLPLRDTDRTFGLLALYSPEVAQVSEDEIKLLQALADDLAFGINNIRAQDERRRLQLAAVKVAAGVSASTGTEFFEQLARNMAEAVGAHAGYLVRLLPGEPATARTIAGVVDGALIGNVDYPLAGTPCEKVFQDQQCVASVDVASRYPAASPLYLAGAEAYVGCRLDNSLGQPVGLLFVLFREPLKRAEFVVSTLRIFATRAAAELERQQADARIRAQASLLDKANDAIVVRGLDSRILFWNKGAERLYGWSAEEVVGTLTGEVMPGNSIGVVEMTRKLLDAGEWTGEFTQTRKNGARMDVEGHLTLVLDDAGQPHSILSISNDITQRKAAQAEIQNLAFYDPLTRLPNRVLLMDRLQHAMATSARNRCEGALLFIDLDDFKTLNDTLGHDVGDQLLQQAAIRLVSSVRESDTVARLGGDEFVVILESLNENPVLAAAQAQSVGEKILASMCRPYVLNNSEHFSTCSIGITLFADPQNNLNELLKRADLAMYQSKASGRNTLRFFNSDMQADVTARALLEAELRQGLKDRQFVLFYQPQMNDAQRVIGVEALVRWQHPRRGLVAPGEFIALAEDTGLILPLGQWVLEAACAQLAAWAAQPETASLTIAVNVSVRQFRHADFVGQVLAILAGSGASPHKLKLELTESLLVDNVETTIEKMAALKACGVSFSLDDFGTGYSSLSYLKRLPLDQLKIDQSFVKDVLSDSNDAVIARTIIALGQNLGLEVIAEGVETEAQRAFLAENGCHFYQGYLFGQPLPANEFEARIINSRSG